MKKILITGLGGGYGGVSNVLISVLRSIPSNTLDITVIETYDSVYHEEILALGYKIAKLPPFKKYLRYKKAVKKLLSDQIYDVVWVNNTSKVDLIVMKYAKRNGSKIITHSHGSIQEGGCFKKTIYEFLSKINEKKFYSLLDYGIACSQSSADYFYREKKLNGKRVEVLLNAIDCEKYVFSQSDRESARKEFGVHNDDIVLACIGRICEVKNLGFALKILAQLPPEYKLIFIGGGDIGRLKTEISDSNLNERVQILGERNNVEELLNGVDILLLPSFSEGLPMVVLEAQANGMKCMISDKVSTECKALESVKFIGIDDERKWVDAIINADIRRTRNAIDIMKEKGFDIGCYTQRLLEIINEVS